MNREQDRLSTASSLDQALSAPVTDQTGELKVVSFRPHARHLLWCALILMGLAGAVPFFAGTFLEEWQNWAVWGGAAAILLLFVLGPFFSWLARTTTVTTRRVIVRSGVITRHRSEVSLAQVRELKLKRGPVQRMYSAGDILLQSSLGEPFVLRNVPRVKAISSALQELIEWQHVSQNLIPDPTPGYR